jgi:hypothetical protein
MTAEQRTFIEAKDILAIEFGCATCGTRVRYPLTEVQPNQFKSRQHNCPNCREGLLAPFAESPEVNRVADLIEVLQRLAANPSKAIIRLEVTNLSGIAPQ